MSIHDPSQRAVALGPHVAIPGAVQNPPQLDDRNHRKHHAPADSNHHPNIVVVDLLILAMLETSLNPASCDARIRPYVSVKSCENCHTCTPDQNEDMGPNFSVQPISFHVSRLYNDSVESKAILNHVKKRN
jgi:hypothetical protein